MKRVATRYPTIGCFLLIVGLGTSLSNALAEDERAARIDSNCPGPGCPSGPLTEVIKLRTKAVALYDKPNGTKIAEFAQADFKRPWPVLAATREGFLLVDTHSKQLWVRAFAVETNKPIVMKAECDVTVSQGVRSAATRGLGKECK